MVANVAFLFWWVTCASSPFIFNSPGFRLSLAPLPIHFFWGCVVLALGNIALAAINLRSRYWTRLRATCRLVLDLTAGVLFCWLMRSNPIATLSVANFDPARSLAITNTIHLWMDRTFPIAVILVAIVVVIDLMRILRLNRTSGYILPQGITA